MNKHDLNDILKPRERNLPILKKSLRSEEEIDTITPYIHAPIRIHKYNIDNDMEQEQAQDYQSIDDLQDILRERLQKRSFNIQDSQEDYEQEQDFGRNRLIALEKRPTLNFIPYHSKETDSRFNQNGYYDYEDDGENCNLNFPKN